jgi:hypothetical protein
MRFVLDRLVQFTRLFARLNFQPAAKLCVDQSNARTSRVPVREGYKNTLIPRELGETYFGSVRLRIHRG